MDASDKQAIKIDMPKYACGKRVVALINNQLRQAVVEEAYLQANIIADTNGVRVDGVLRWEYRVLVINDPVEASEKMIITERTIIDEVTETPDDKNLSA